MNSTGKCREKLLIYLLQGADGICVVKTVQAILVGTYKEGIQPGNCAKVVEGLADYLISTGYVSTIIPMFLCMVTDIYMLQ